MLFVSRIFYLAFFIFLGGVHAQAQPSNPFAMPSSSVVVPYPKLWTGTENGVTYLYRDPVTLSGAPLPAPVPPAPLPTPIKMEIITLDAGRPYFHWADKTSASRWESQGGHGLSDQEFHEMRMNGNGEAAGGGFYISADFTNSDSYGSDCVKVTLNKKVQVLKGNAYFFFASEMGQGASMQWMSEVLQSAGVDGIAYSNIDRLNYWWINLFKKDDIVTLSPATIDDFLTVADSNYQYLLNWLSLLLKSGLDPAIDPILHLDQIAARFPIVKRLVDQSLNEADLDLIWDEVGVKNQLSAYYHILGLWNPQATLPAAQELFQYFEMNALKPHADKPAWFNYLISHIGSVIEQHLNDPGVRKKFAYDFNSYQILKQFVPPNILGPLNATVMTTRFLNLLPIDFTYTTVTGKQLQNDFLTRYYRSFAFIDLADRLAAQERGNNRIESLYDEPGVNLYDNWVNFRLEIAQKEADARNGGGPSATVGSGGLSSLFSADDLYFSQAFSEFYQYKSSLDQMKVLVSRLSSHKITEVRDTPIVAGGDYGVNGIHYYRVSRSELQVLQANPYLSVETIEDPNAPAGSDWVLARHEYPSARTYLKFKNKLSPALQASLMQADTSGALKDTASPEFKTLTQAVLSELWADVVKENDASRVYQISISIHPFADYNGRSMRFLFSLGNGKPLILRNWDWDLFLSTQDFNYERLVGQYFFGMLGLELMQLQGENPTFPKAYDAKSPYAFFFDHGNLAHVASDSYLNQAKTFFHDQRVSQLVSQKMILESGNLGSSPCALILGAALKD